MFSSHREDLVYRLYKKHDIAFATDLSIENLSKAFHILVNYYPHRSRCIHDNDVAMILLKSGQSIDQTKYEFFHEFAHFLIHFGDQRKMNKEFVRLQEIQAHQVALYAAMPRYIIDSLLSQHTSIYSLADHLQLPPFFVYERMTQITHRTTKERRYEYDKSLKQKNSPFRISKETKRLLKQLQAQVGEERISYDIKSVL